jgi:hypothetical protein
MTKLIPSILFGMAILGTLPHPAVAGACSADAFCNNTASAIKSLISDPKCKADASCVQCVANSVGNGQIADYCSAYQATSKSSTLQVVSAGMFGVTSGVCLLACAIQKNPVTGATGAGPTLSRLCRGAALVDTAYDFVSSLTSNDPSGLVSGALGLDSAFKDIFETKVVEGITKTTKTLKMKTKLGACLTGGLYFYLAANKMKSLGGMKKSKRQSCDIISKFGSSTQAATQSCQGGGVSTSPPPSTQLAGLFSATPETFSALTIQNGASQLASTASDAFIKDMTGDLQTASDLGIFSLPDIAKKIDGGASASDVIGTFGLPPEMNALMKDIERRVDAGEHFKLPPGMEDGYSGGSGNLLGSTGAGGLGDLSFGSGGATPGEGANSLDIERKPAQTTDNLGLDNNSDVFHEAFTGTIFDIVTHRLKAEKGNYAELDPAGRMNRLFNGYREPAAKNKGN